MIVLTQDERQRFAAYLDELFASNEQLIAQMEKLPGVDAGLKRYRTEAMAAKIVSQILLSTYTDNLGGS